MIYCCGEMTEYGEGNDNKTLDAIGHDLTALIRLNKQPMLISVGDCIDCKIVEAQMAEELRNRYSVRLTLGKVEL